MARRRRPLAVAIVLLVPATVHAHDRGTSRTMLTELENGTVHGTFTFAASEARAALDRHGHVAIEVRADGDVCAPGAVVESTDVDDLVFDEDFACARATSSIVATAHFLDKLGDAHESAASIEAFGDTSNVAFAFLRTDHPTLAKELHRPRPKSHRRIYIAAAMGAALVLLLTLRSLRARPWAR